MNIADKVKMKFEDAIHSAIKDWQRDADEPATRAYDTFWKKQEFCAKM